MFFNKTRETKRSVSSTVFDKRQKLFFNSIPKAFEEYIPEEVLKFLKTGVLNTEVVNEEFQYNEHEKVKIISGYMPSGLPEQWRVVLTFMNAKEDELSLRFINDLPLQVNVFLSGGKRDLKADEVAFLSKKNKNSAKKRHVAIGQHSATWGKDARSLEPHREGNKPASIFYYSNGAVFSETYYIDGVFSKQNETFLIGSMYYLDGNVAEESRIPELAFAEGLPRRVIFNRKGDPIRELYCNDSRSAKLTQQVTYFDDGSFKTIDLTSGIYIDKLTPVIYTKYRECGCVEALKVQSVIQDYRVLGLFPSSGKNRIMKFEEHYCGL